LRWNYGRDAAYHNNQPFQPDSIHTKACDTVPSSIYLQPIVLWWEILLCFLGSQYRIIPAKTGKPVQLVLMQI
jgi:hypothetical protein